MIYEKIIVAVDLSSESKKILNIALSISNNNLDALHVIHAIDPMPILPYEAHVPDMEKTHHMISVESEKQLNSLADSVNIPRENQQILTGRSSTEICRYATESSAQLIILGSHGVSGWKALLGSTANSVVQEADCDVLTVRVGKKS